MPTIEERALALVNEVMDQTKRGSFPCRLLPDADAIVLAEALCRALEAHDAALAEFEAFRREVSDAVELDKANYEGLCFPRLSRFILAKPDPLVEAVRDCGYATLDAIEPEFVADLRAALAKRGLKLVEVGDAD